MAKKVSKKEQILKNVEEIENSTDKIDVSEINTNIEDVKESIQNVNVELENQIEENLEQIANETMEALNPINEIIQESKNLGVHNPELDEKLSNASKEEVETYLKDEIEKAEKLQEKIEKISNDSKPFSKAPSMTNWWNGMNYDFNG